MGTYGLAAGLANWQVGMPNVVAAASVDAGQLLGQYQFVSHPGPLAPPTLPIIDMPDPRCSNRRRAVRDEPEQEWDPVADYYAHQYAESALTRRGVQRLGDVVVGSLQVVGGTTEIILGGLAIATCNPLGMLFGTGSVIQGGGQLTSGISRLAGWGDYDPVAQGINNALVDAGVDPQVAPWITAGIQITNSVGSGFYASSYLATRSTGGLSRSTGRLRWGLRNSSDEWLRAGVNQLDNTTGAALNSFDNTTVAVLNSGDNTTAAALGSLDNTGMGAARGGGRSGSGYDFTADLGRSSARSRPGHRYAANRQLHDAMVRDPALRARIEAKYGSDVFDLTSTSGTGRRNPTGGIWHHDPQNPNALHLVTKEEHARIHAREGLRGGYSLFWKE